jgi:hypothetical protein
MHHPTADEQCRYDLKMAAKVHQEIHRKFELINSHVEQRSVKLAPGL